jgi:hypothetical protein
VQKQSAARDALVVDYMQGLLVEMANAPERMVGRIDGNLTELISAFPFLLFDADLIGTLLEIVNVFERFRMGTTEKEIEYQIRNTPHKVVLRATGTNERLERFVCGRKSWIEEAFKMAPLTTISTLICCASLLPGSDRRYDPQPLMPTRSVAEGKSSISIPQVQ